MNTVSYKATFLLLAALAGFTPLANRLEAATIPITNFSFEGGTTGRPFGMVNGARFSQLNVSGPSWDVYSALRGWKTASGLGIEVQSDRTLSNIDAQDGDHYIELDGLGNSSISQKLNLSAGSYVLSFWYSPRTTLNITNTIGYSLGSIVSGQVTHGTGGASVGVWTEVRTTFTVLSGANYDLTFAALGTSDGIGGFIDNVTLETVPVPAAGLGLLTGLFLLGGLRSRQRRA